MKSMGIMRINLTADEISKLSRKEMIIVTVVRFVIEALFCIGVYKETGIWTTIVILLIFASIEINNFNVLKIARYVNLIKDRGQE